MKPDFRVNNFDLVRIFAAAQVMVLHSYSHLDVPIPAWLAVFENFPGVPMFFVISGYLISASYERSTDLKGYATNRALRIYPGLWACILLTVVTASLFGGISFFHPQALVWFVTQLVGLIYTPEFLRSYGFGSYNGSLWTIPIELQFYLVLPAIYWVVMKTKRPTAGLVAVWLAFIALSYTLFLVFPGLNSDTETRAEKLLRYSFLPQFFLFLTGVVLQRLQAFQSPLIYGKGPLWVAAYLLFVYTVPEFGGRFLISGMFLAVTTLSMAYTRPGLAHKALRGNDISYGVYIYHGLLLNIFVELDHFHRVPDLLALIALTVGLAFLSWRVVEEPMIRKKPKTMKSGSAA